MSDVPCGWEQTRLGNLGRYINGRGFKSSEWSDSGRPIIRIQNLTGSSSKINHYNGEVDPQYVVEPGDLLISWSATLGAYFWTGPQAVLNQHIFRVESYINKKFHKYLVDYILRDLMRKTHGSGMVHITRKPFDETPVFLPPLAEQGRIVAAIEQQFSQIDAGIAALETVLQGLRRMRAAVYRQIYDRALLQSQPRPLREICEFIVDGDHNPPKRTVEGIPYLTAKHVKHGHISTDGASFISQEEFALLRRRYDPQKGDVIVTCVGTLGEVAVVPDGLIFAADRNLAAIRPSTQVTPSFLEAMLRSPSLQKVLTVGSGSTAQPHLYLRDLRQLQVPVPALDMQESLIASLREQLAFADQLETDVKVALTRGERLRVSILAAAFSGKLVRQDGDEEPASILLKRIAEEWASSKGRMPTRTHKR